MKLVKYGLPFLTLVVGGSLGLREFTQLRYQFSKKSTVRPEELEKIGVQMRKQGEVTLESEYEKIKGLDIDDWENKRVFRPWEQHSN
jgi:cytochrome c oxidase assembly protein subunit 16